MAITRPNLLNMLLPVRLRGLRAQLVQKILSRRFWIKYKNTIGQRKVIYTLTPTPELRNVGDHAQVVAIYKWIAKHFPGLPIIEMDKNESTQLVKVLKRVVSPDDFILIHSGGNLGDRGIWSETARRAIISNFPDNQIVSLPQTIFFSETPKGWEERERSRAIYGRHSNLTVIGRDPRSGELAKELFPDAHSFCVPDFVLSLDPRPGRAPDTDSPNVLLCLRLDNESVMDAPARQALADAIPYDTEFYDTTIDESIEREDRVSVLDQVLSLFASKDAVVTDRFHGVIFSVLAGRPTVVLRTVDHKLTSALHWFDSVSFVKFAASPEDVPQVLEAVLKTKDFSTPDWNELYFDGILEKVSK